MSDKYPKVLQVHMTEAQHDSLRCEAFRVRMSMVECVRKWIGENCTPKGITMVPKEHRDKVTGGYVVKEPVGQVVKPVGDLREGYGWCCACKVKQVKLPGMLCPSCAKPPVEKGEVSK